MTDDLSKDNNYSYSSLRVKKNYTHLIYQSTLILIFIISYIYVFDVKLDLNGDNFEYLNLAKSIFEGKGYSFLYSPNHAPTNWFPPGYPGIIALIMFLIGKNIMIFKMINEIGRAHV